jgi:methionyl-tRNA formyltransferase
MNIIFMGSPDFALPTLEALIASEHTVVGVYSQPPKPAGRGKKDRKTAIHTLAEKHSLPVFTPKSLKGKKEQDDFKTLSADIAVVAAYGLILPKAILSACPKGCINIHPSLLPRWRGAAPIQRTIMAGDKETGVCIMQMDEGLDTGDILVQEMLEIEEHMNAGLLHDSLAELGAQLILQTLKNNYVPKPQGEKDTTYAEKISKQEAAIDWSLDAKVIYNHIRGLSPWPGAYFTFNGERIKLLAAEWHEPDHRAPAGTALDEHLTISCGKGTLTPLELQRAGKKPMPRDVFLRGFDIPTGTVLE